MRSDIDDQREEITRRLQAGESKYSVYRWLNCKPETLDKRLRAWGIFHLNNRGGRGKESPHYRSASEYMQPDGPEIQGHTLKKKLWKEGLKLRQCERCGITEWQGEPAPLELDHIDGNRYNNVFENLRILCPNCHSLTPTHGVGNVKYQNKIRMIRGMNEMEQG